MNAISLAAGVVMTGFDGTSLDEPTVARLTQLPFAGYILFARNVDRLESVRALTDRLRELSEPPPIVAIDQEGGRVARIRDGVEELPPMMALGATRDRDLAFRAGAQLGHDLRRAGITHDFAPVADLALDAANTVIGARAFASSPQLVIQLAGAFARGMGDAGMGSTIKHFPGHGSTSVDSHVALPVLDAGAATLRARDLEPFRMLLPEVTSVMAAHVVARAFDDALPASLSPKLLTGILRDEWGFNGVCFTDCMQMDAIARGVGTVEGVAAAIAAGADCAIVSHDPDLAAAAVMHLASEVEAGRIPRSRVEEAYARTMRLRAAASPPLPLDDPAPHAGIGREIARRAVTCIRGVAHADSTASVVVSFEGATVEGAQGRLDLRASLRSQAPALAEIVVSLEPAAQEAAAVLDALEQQRRRPIVLARRARELASQRACIEGIIDRCPDTIVVCAREPFDAPLFARAKHLLATYGDTPVSLQGLADVLFGDGDAQGVLPVEFPDA